MGFQLSITHHRQFVEKDTKMSKLTPEWVLSLPEPAIDGFVDGAELFVLGTTQIFIFQLSTRLRLGQFNVESPGEVNLALTHDGEGRLILTKRCGALYVYKRSGELVAKAKLISNAGFTGAKVSNGRVYAMVAGLTAEEVIQVFKLPELKYEQSLVILDKGHLGLPMCFTVGQNKIRVGFESGDVITWSESKMTFVAKESYSSSTLMHIAQSQSSFYIYDCKGVMARYEAPNGLKKRQKEYSPHTSAMELRHDGKLIALATSTGKIRLLSAKSLKTLSVLQAHTGHVHNVVWEGHEFYCFGDDKKVTCFLPYTH